MDMGSTGGKKPCLGTEVEDRISSLDDVVLIRILSFLPTRDAVKTVLIRRFGDLWTSVDTLEFDSCSYHVCGEMTVDADARCLTLTRHSLILHSRPSIYKFSLKFPFSYSLNPNTEEYTDAELDESEEDSDAEENEEDTDAEEVSDVEVNESAEEALIRKKKLLANELDTWIIFAVRRNVKILHLDTKMCSESDPETCYVLPNAVLLSRVLTELIVVQCRLEPRGRVYMESLKRLTLREIIISDEVLHSIVDGSPQLEHLSLLCYGLSKLTLTSASLTTLVISVWQSRKSRLELCCSNIRSLKISGLLEMVDLMDVSHVVNARLKFSYHFPCEDKKYSEIRRIFEKLRHAEILKICTWCIMVFTIWELKTLPCPSNEWKHLVLQTRVTKWHLPGIASLLRNSPLLESLKIEVCHEASAFPDDESKWLERYEFDEANYWSMVEPFNYSLNELKCVYIYAEENGSVIHPLVINLVKFLLKSSPVMEKMRITIKLDGQPQWSERLLEFTQELISFPKASSRAIILFI